MTTSKKSSGAEPYGSPLRLLILVTASILIAEVGVMTLLLFLPPLPHAVAAVIDAVLLAILIYPILYRYMMRPMTRQVDECQRTGAALRSAHDELERRVQERTAELSSVNAGLQAEIEERQRVEARLRESEQKYRAIVETASEGIVTTSPEGNYLFANQYMADMLGCSVAEILGKTSLDFTFDDEQPRVWQARRDLQAGDVLHGEFKFRRNDGSVLWSLYNASPIFNDRGEHIANLAMHTDITLRKQMDETLQQHAEELEAARTQAENESRRLEAVMDALPVGMAITDVNGGTLQVNAAYDRVWGGPRPVPLSVDGYAAYQAWWVATGKAIAPAEWASAQVVQTGQPVVGQLLEIQRFDGSRAFVINSASPVRDASGEIIGSAVAIQDITAMHRTQQALRESEEKYRALFESIDQGFCTIEVLFDQTEKPVDYRFLIVNPAFERQTGISSAAGRRMREIEPLLEEYWFQVYGRIALTGEALRFENRAEQLHRDYDVYAWKIGGPADRQVAVLFNDITERKQAEEALIAARRQVERERDILQTVMNGAKRSHLAYLDRGFNFVRVNQTFAESGGYRPEEMIGKNHFALYPHEENEAIFARVRDTGEPVEFHDKPFEFSNQPERGITYWDWTLNPVRDERGEVEGLVLSLFETTEHKRLEQALRAARDELELRVQERTAALSLLSRVVEQTADTVVITDRAGMIEYVNPAVEQLTGYTKAEVFGHNPRLFKSGLHGEQFYQELWSTILRGDVFFAEMTNRKKNGEFIHSVETITPIRDAQGTITHFVATGKDITEHRRAEQALELSEKKFRALFETAPVGISVLDQNRRISDVNEALKRILRISGEGLLAGAYRDRRYIRGDGTPMLPDEFASARAIVENRPVHDAEVGVITEDGSIIWTLVSAAPLGLPETSAVVITQDITDRKRTVEQLRVQTAAIEAAANGIIITDRRGHIEWCNPAFTRMTGYSSDEVLGQNTRILKSGQYPPELYRQLWTTILAGHTWHGELVNRRKDGSTYMEEQTITPVLDREGQISHFIAIKQDITDRKRAEESIRLGAARAEAMAEVSRAIAEAGLDHQTILDIVAQGAARLVGGTCVIHLLSEDKQWFKLAAVYHAGPATGSHLREVLAAEAYRVQEGPAAQVAQTGQPQLIPIVSLDQLRAMLKPKHQSYLDHYHVTSLLIVPLRRRGQIAGTLAVARERPAQPLTLDDQFVMQRLADRAALAIDNARLYQDLERTLREEQDMREQLVQSEKFAALGRIVAAVAHELNNPLQTIQNCLFLARQEIAPGAPAHEHLQMAAAEVQRLSGLVAQLRTLQRSRVSGPGQPFDLRLLLEEVHNLLGPQLEAHHVQWQSAGECQDAVVSGAAEQLKQVFLNIALNAIEAMQPGGGVLRIELAAADSGEQIGVRLQDTGSGIAPEHLSRMFEPLFTTKPHGLGLGLPICYEIVQRHGGRITIDSELARGTTVAVWLPLAARA